MTPQSVLIKITTLFFIGSIFLISCTKDKEDELSKGRFEDYKSCTIVSPPSDADVLPYYTKYLNCSGIAIIGSSDIDDKAFFVADSTVNFLLEGLDDVKARLISSGEYIAIYPLNENYNTLPEFASYFSTDFSGVYVGNIHGLAVSMANLLCYPSPTNTNERDNVLVHEFAHMLHLSGFEKEYSSFDSELRSAYTFARSNNLWDNTYGATNFVEYFAVGVQIWYNQRYPFGPVGGDGSGNEIIKRTQLEQYDTRLYNLIEKYFNTGYDVPGCSGTPLDNPVVPCANTVSDIDGNIYNVVSIGPQCWLKENLKTTRFNNGTLISQVDDLNQWAALTSSGRCVYDNDNTNLVDFGYLYNWESINSSEGICPNGWHVPTDADWEILISSAGFSDAGANLNSNSNLWNQPNQLATNSTGFFAEPGGYRNETGGYQDYGGQAIFWSSNEENNLEGKTKRIFDNHQSMFDFILPKTSGAYCRCVID